MGTNYYLRPDACECCGRSETNLHIGKSSGGWCFGLRIHPDENIFDLPDWEKLWNDPKSKIVDEYSQPVSAEEMRDIITNRSWKNDFDKPYPTGEFRLYSSWEEFHRKNHSESGPNGLLRHRSTSDWPCGHGEGTWDLLDREFS